MSNFDPRALGMYRARRTEDTCALCGRRPEPKPGQPCEPCRVAYFTEQPKRRRKEAA